MALANGDLHSCSTLTPAGLPVMPFQTGAQSLRSLKPAAAQQEQPPAAAAQARARDETAEQRKARKQAVKESQVGAIMQLMAAGQVQLSSCIAFAKANMVTA